MIIDANSEEFADVRDALLAWKNLGITDPTIPIYEDLDEDGEPDFYGLNEDNDLIVVSGITVFDTVSPLDVPEDVEDDE